MKSDYIRLGIVSVVAVISMIIMILLSVYNNGDYYGFATKGKGGGSIKLSPTLSLEAESGSSQGFMIGEDPKASDKQYIYSPDGSGSISYSFNIDKAGLYKISTKVATSTPYAQHNSFYLQLNANERALVKAVESNNYRWNDVYLNGKKEWFLNPGTHTIKIEGRDPHVKIDSILLSLSATQCADNDKDGYGRPTSELCLHPHEDCNDLNMNINPGALEICDNKIDDDCDGQVNEGCAQEPVCIDNDNDGYGENCANGKDCDDTNPSVNVLLGCSYNGNICFPDMALCVAKCPIPPNEICGNGIDEDCNGVDLSCVDNSTVFTVNDVVQAELGDNNGFKIVNGYVYTDVDEQNSISYTFSVPQSGQYVIDTGMVDPTSATDSFYVGLDGFNAQGNSAYVYDSIDGPGVLVDTVRLRGPNGNFTYSMYDPMIYDLEAGLHTFTFYGRERNTKMDYLMLKKYYPIANVLPNIEIISPKDNSSIILGSNVNFDVNASDSDGTIVKVEFYVNGALLSSDYMPPYYYIFTPNYSGIYNLNAVAYDNIGATDSKSVTLNVLYTINHSQSKISRHFSSNILYNNTELIVTLKKDLSGGEKTVLLEEIIPEGFTIVNAGTGVVSGNIIRWAELGNAVSGNNTYLVITPSIFGNYTFSGKYTLYTLDGGEEKIITGESSVSITSLFVCSDGETQSCSTGLLGVCDVGTQTCYNNSWGACVQNVQASTEICGNGIDEDCNGADLTCQNVSSVLSRSFSANPTATGTNVTVTITKTLQSGQSTLLIEEYVPAGFTIVSSGTGTANGNTIRWAELTGASSGTYTYTVSTPLTAGNYTFSGSYTINGGSITNIEGSTVLNVEQVFICSNGQTQNCSTGQQGVCAIGTMICSNNNWGSCNAPAPTIEVCNNEVDEDCDGVLNNGCSGYCDTDGDGHNQQFLLWCVIYGPIDDCNDNDATIYLGATEICGNGIDEDCSGSDLLCPNTPPIVSISSPVTGSTFNQGDNITIVALASDPNGSVSKVEFYSNNALVSTDTSFPYSHVWINATIGTYSVYARAYDNLNASTSSGTITLYVVQPTCLNGQTQSCTTGLLGICSAGIATCSNNVWGACVQNVQASTEICGNGIDEDCNGADLTCQSNSLSRSFSANPVSRNSTVTVTITKTLLPSQTTLLTEEYVPEGLTIVNAGTGSVVGNTIRWAELVGAASGAYTYTIMIPNIAAGYTFNGMYSINGGAETQISGSTQLTVQ